MSWIYIYTNKINGMQYVGETTHIVNRLAAHKRCYDIDSSYIERAICKYGIDSFDIEFFEVPKNRANPLRFAISKF